MTAEIVKSIERLQAIQKRNPPASDASATASAELASLFVEVAKRQRANGGEADWRKWKEDA